MNRYFKSIKFTSYMVCYCNEIGYNNDGLYPFPIAKEFVYYAKEGKVNSLLRVVSCYRAGKRSCERDVFNGIMEEITREQFLNSIAPFVACVDVEVRVD